MEFRLASRRLLLIGMPVVLASLMIVHQLIDQFERPVAFLGLHLILLSALRPYGRGDLGAPGGR